MVLLGIDILIVDCLIPSPIEPLQDHNIDRAIDMLASGRYLDKSEVIEEFADLLDASLDYFLLRQPTTRLIELLEKVCKSRYF